MSESRTSLTLVLIGIVALAATVLCWFTLLQYSKDALCIGLSIGIAWIVAGAIYFAVHFIRSRSKAERQPLPAEHKRWADFFLPIGLALFALPFLCVAFVAAAVDGYANLAFAMVVLSLIFAGMAFLCFLLSLGTAWLRRRTTERIVIGQIALVVRQNLPLATGLALAAESERGPARRHLSRISRLLAQGSSLAEATQRGFPDCPSLPLSLIVAGERAGQLPAALEQAEQFLVDRARRRDGIDISIWPYALCVLLVSGLLVSGIMVAVIPKFKEIFKDFGTSLPPLTSLLIGVCSFVAQWALLPIMLLLFFIVVPVGLYLNLRPRRVSHLALTSRIADWVRWYTPGWRAMEFSLNMTAVLRTIRLGVRAGMDLEPAVRLAANIDLNNQLRPRIAQFADLLARGANLRLAAEQAGLGSVAAVALASGQRAADLDAALRFAADYHDALVNRFWIVVRNLAWPVCTLLLGIVIGTIVFSLFQPLVYLINSVASGGR